MLDDIDRRIVNALQGGLPVCERPYAEVARRLDIAEDALIERIGGLLECGALSRFGPMFDAAALGGAFSLVALEVPDEDFDEVAALVNAHPEVAHNYAREHSLNMWFVLACEKPERIDEVLAEIEDETGLEPVNLPKLDEFFVGLRFAL